MMTCVSIAVKQSPAYRDFMHGVSGDDGRTATRDPTDVSPSAAGSAHNGRRDQIRCVMAGGLLTGIADGVFGIAQYTIAATPSPVARFFQAIAAVVLGKRPFHGGAPAVALGAVMHFGVAMFWAAVFALLFMRSRLIRETLASRGGAVKVAVVYGPVIWMIMSFVVISTLVGHLPTIGRSWWIEFFGHIFSAGLPIALVFRTQTQSA